ncbi:MAG: hypothetical protein E7588_03605 [Ruminococcaceae bacterium]|nr:hypothetical protein [Oscillospiraceae bacterium]
MKKIFLIITVLAAVVFMLQRGTRDKVIGVFRQNVGFDDLSRSIEVSISENPVAAMVFGMDTGGAVQVFAGAESEQ